MLERVLHLGEGVCKSSWESDMFCAKRQHARAAFGSLGTCLLSGSGNKGRFYTVTSRGNKKASSARNGKGKLMAVHQ